MQNLLKLKQSLKEVTRIKINKETRCCSSIATHNINKSLLGPEFDPSILDESKRSNKINLKTKSKTKKTPSSKLSDNINCDTSFQQKTSLNLSQMFNYYANHPINDKQNRKQNKNHPNAYRSYTSASVNKQKHPKSKSTHPSIVLAPQQRGRLNSTNYAQMQKKDKKLAKRLDISMNKYNKIFESKSNSKSKSKNKGISKRSKIVDIKLLRYLKGKASRSYSRSEGVDSQSKAHQKDFQKHPALNFLFNLKSISSTSAK